MKTALFDGRLLDAKIGSLFGVGYVSALDISAPEIWAPGLFGARTFFLDSLFCRYVVSVCSSLRSR